MSANPRTIILCFDGTGGKYNAMNTNVVKLFSLLKKDNNEQLVYYQAGVGTYEAPGIAAGIQKKIAMLLDEAIAWYIDGHIMGGYKYLMQTYNEGDRICIFGFSRGAYTARALAGMLHKVGLLPRNNEEQIGFAYNMYQSISKNSPTLSQGFKGTFSRRVNIEFMGCWDTVSSVGVLWSRHLPFTAGTTTIKTFRHALSLDEHRAKFQPNTWHRNAPDADGAAGDPEHGTPVVPPTGGPPESQSTDVLEVWFAGCHSDIGGGVTPNGDARTVSNISLRWMIREIVVAKCGIQFDSSAVQRAGIPLTMVFPNLATSNAPDTTPAKATSPLYTPQAAQDDKLDAPQAIHDELQINPAWWILEVIPFYQSWQDESGRWHCEFRCNLGRGRIIVGQNPNIHVTVQQRMQNPSLTYTPRAQWQNSPNANWVE